MLAIELLVDESRPDELLPLDTDSGESRFLFWPVPDGWFVSGEDGTFQISGGVVIMCVCPSGDGIERWPGDSQELFVRNLPT